MKAHVLAPLALGLLVLVAPRPAEAHVGALAIPAFARQYRTTCTTCHVAPPKLNALGEAFRLNGYRFPRTTRLVRQEPTISLGDEEWKDEWPRAIWPGELSGSPGISMRVQSDVEVRRASPGSYAWTYRFPSDVYLLGAATLGDGLAAFVESEWSPDAGFRVLQAKVTLQDPVPALPRHLVGVWFGLQALYPMMLAERQVDRAARQLFSWQGFAASDLRLLADDGASIRSTSDFRLVASQPSVEVEGVVSGRLGYGIGLAQGTSPGGTDRNNHKDTYARLRYKLGGLRLDGEHGTSPEPARASAGQLRDGTLILEAFAYRGAEPGAAGRVDRYRRLGGGARLLVGPADLGLGVVRARHEDPWGRDVGAEFTSWFAKAEILVLPWAMLSLKGERARFRLVDQAPPEWRVEGEPGRLVVMPGIVLLARPNARFVVEGDLHLRHPGATPVSRPRPHALWIRTDLSF